MAAALQYLALINVSKGDLAAARPLFAEALSIYKATPGAERSAAHMTLALAELEFQAGDSESALTLALEALASDRDRQDDNLVIFDLCNVSAYRIALGRFDEALQNALEAFSLALVAHVDTIVIVAAQHVAAVAALREDPPAVAAAQTAARLLGFVEARAASTSFRRDYTEAQEYERIDRRLRTSLSEAEYDALRREGARWTPEYAAGIARGVSAGTAVIPASA